MMNNTLQEQKENLLREVEKLHQRYELSKTLEPDYFEPGMMEYLDQSEGVFYPETGDVLIRFEVKGTRYEGRTEQIEKVKVRDTVQICRDRENAYNSNNFMILTSNGKSLGNMPAQLCNVIAPLYDSGNLIFNGAEVSFTDPISRRSRHAKQAVLFVQLKIKLNV